MRTFDRIRGRSDAPPAGFAVRPFGLSRGEAAAIAAAAGNATGAGTIAGTTGGAGGGSNLTSSTYGSNFSNRSPLP